MTPLNVLVQVNVSAEASKSGVAPAQALSLCEQIHTLDNLRLRGLMAIPEPGAPRSRFHEVRVLFEALKPQFGFDTLSMGMSDDLDVAIAEGATLVRIGTAIFGARRKRAPAMPAMGSAP
jgi:pyridoxal phosphate enzyme (YggS family)